MKYRKFIVGESLGMIFSSLVILAGLAVFGENTTAEDSVRAVNIAATSINPKAPLSVQVSNIAVSLDEAETLVTETEEIKALL